MQTKQEKIKKYGIEIVEQDEKEWKKRGYKINYKTGLLENLTASQSETMAR